MFWEHRYDTLLKPINENKYIVDKYLSPFRNDSGYDYDLRGYYNKYHGLNSTASNGHLTDEFKKPNHPTFSIESNYYRHGNPAVDWNSDFGKMLMILGY